MAITNSERLFKAFTWLSEGLYDLVDETMGKAFGGSDWPEKWALETAQRKGGRAFELAKDDVQVQLRAITEQGYHFKDVLSRTHQGYAQELREMRNELFHRQGKALSADDTSRALDTMQRLLTAAGAVDSANDIKKLRTDLQRTVFEDQTRKQVKRTQVSLDPGSGLKPWREVIQPHDDVARGEFTASEFAADLHLVRTGEATSPEYGVPVEFFTRTYLTEGLHDLLFRALLRLSGDNNASPVVNLQTNFGGGKTHSMLALYHLFSGTPASELPQDVQDLVDTAGSPDLTALGIKRVALVGTYLQAGSPLIKDDGTEVRTLWGELAWQLGGREAYDIIAQHDLAGTNPGESLRTLLQQHTPALILIDEWVAYARQLVGDRDLPAGSFETQFTFAQSLTEIIRSLPGAMLVVSIPASDVGDTSADIEVGGNNGKMALDRLQNVIRRVADQWRPSSRDESFEIVRRRLFQAPGGEGLKTISAVARSFVTMYRNNTALFPRGAASPNDEYEKRIRASYPIHPELLDRLYEDWSTLERFQRTRGVLKLVSSIVHELWASNDTSPLILPGNVPLETTTVNTDLTQYLEDQWKPIIDSDIDGPGATAQQIDLDRPNLGQRFITRRLARTIFMGAAPRTKSTRKGLDKQYLWLGTATPGDTLGNFGTAVDLLAQRSTYFYEEQGHYWFDTQPSIAKTARDYAERLREDPDTVWNEITRRLQGEDRSRGHFDRVHVAPSSSADIPDIEDTRLVVVHPRYARRKQDGADSEVHQWVRSAIETKGASQRTHRNTLVFLVSDTNLLETLEAATRSYLGWQNVKAHSEEFNLSAQQNSQAVEQVSNLDRTVTDRIRDTYVWALYPEQHDPTRPFEINADRVPDSGGRSLAERVSTKLAREDLLVTDFGAPILGATLHKELASIWQQNGELSIGELWGYFTRYVYMPRLISREVLDRAVEQAISTVMVQNERFAIASGKERETGRYQNLIVPPVNTEASLQVTNSTLLVDYAIGEKQAESDSRTSNGQGTESAAEPDDVVDTPPADMGWAQPVEVAETEPRRFFGSVTVSSDRYVRDISNVTREVIDRLAGAGAKVEITVDIQASKHEGFDESEVRTISENARTLKFDPSSGFEKH